MLPKPSSSGETGGKSWIAGQRIPPAHSCPQSPGTADHSPCISEADPEILKPCSAFCKLCEPEQLACTTPHPSPCFNLLVLKQGL